MKNIYVYQKADDCDMCCCLDKRDARVWAKSDGLALSHPDADGYTLYAGRVYIRQYRLYDNRETWRLTQVHLGRMTCRSIAIIMSLITARSRRDFVSTFSFVDRVYIAMIY